jgi:hypothetical protein
MFSSSILRHSSQRFFSTSTTITTANTTTCLRVPISLRRQQQQQQQFKQHPTTIWKRIQSTSAEASEPLASVPPPTRRQKWLVFLHAAVPMVGFGFVDQSIMIYAGNAIDCTLGVTFGLSTLTAASVGSLISNSCGVLFGNTLEAIFSAAGLPRSNLSSAQRKLPIISRLTFSGTLIGIIVGGLFGLVNLLFIDTGKSSTLKLQAFNEEEEFEFTIEASNAERENATALTVKGPDVDGLLASMTAALSVRNASIVAIHAERAHPHDDTDTTINDVFYVGKFRPSIRCWCCRHDAY